MKIAIPTANGTLCLHFGHCQIFTIIDISPDSKNIDKVSTLTPPPHEIGVLPAWLHEIGCTHIIAGGMGGRAIALFQQNGIKVICGAEAMKPEDLAKAYLDNQLETGNNCCDDPGFKTGGHSDCGDN